MKPVSNQFRPQRRRQLSVSEFRGIDLYNAPPNVSTSRSPDAPNMTRDVPGKVCKRMGYFQKGSYSARINGVHKLVLESGTYRLVHSGTRLYLDSTLLYSTMANVRSTAWQMGNKLYIVDGKSLLVFDGQTVDSILNQAYVPTIVLSRSPPGGGQSHEGLNLMSSRWKESFLGTAGTAVYQLSFAALDAVVQVRVMLTADVWTTLTAGTHYSVNLALGQVTFGAQNIPGVSPVAGKDNVEITAQKRRTEYENRIQKCDLSVLYGVNGAADRLFVTGNPSYRNYDWYSGLNDPGYFPVYNYMMLGMNSRIMSYSIIGDKLAAHKSDDEDGRNIIVRTGTMMDGQPAFPVTNTLQGAGTVSKYTIDYLNTEPLFYSARGIFAVTPADVSGDRYTQNRSYFINLPLSEELNKEEAVAIVYQDFYLLAINKKIYLLDALMKTYENGAPYSTHQYEAYLWTGIDVRVFYRENGALCFGTADGKLMEFYQDKEDGASYNDNGKAIAAYWDTPLFAGEGFYYRKGFKYLALKTARAKKSSFRVLAQINGIWKMIFEKQLVQRKFSFSEFRFSDCLFSSDEIPRSFGKKLMVPKLDKIQFRFQNDVKDEPFGLYNYAIEFVESGRIK